MIKVNIISITIEVSYSTPRHTISNSVMINYFNTIKNNFTIGGDFNAKHNFWGCHFNNPDLLFYTIIV